MPYNILSAQSEKNPYLIHCLTGYTTSTTSTTSTTPLCYLVSYFSAKDVYMILRPIASVTYAHVIHM